MTDQSSTAIVVIGGDPPHPGVVAHLPSRRIVIAADSGLDHAQALGLQVDLVIGDLDSVSPEALARAEADGIPIDHIDFGGGLGIDYDGDAPPAADAVWLQLLARLDAPEQAEREEARP